MNGARNTGKFQPGDFEFSLPKGIGSNRPGISPLSLKPVYELPLSPSRHRAALTPQQNPLPKSGANHIEQNLLNASLHQMNLAMKDIKLSTNRERLGQMQQPLMPEQCGQIPGEGQL